MQTKEQEDRLNALLKEARETAVKLVQLQKELAQDHQVYTALDTTFGLRIL